MLINREPPTFLTLVILSPSFSNRQPSRHHQQPNSTYFHCYYRWSSLPVHMRHTTYIDQAFTACHVASPFRGSLLYNYRPIHLSSEVFCVVLFCGIPWPSNHCKNPYSIHVSPGSFGGQERMFGSLEMELKASVSSLTWVLGTEFRAWARAVWALNSWVISPAPTCFYMLKYIQFNIQTT